MKLKKAIFLFFVVLTITLSISRLSKMFKNQTQDKNHTEAKVEVLAPKQDLEVLKTRGVIGFRISGELFQQISDWEYSIDEMVFKEQLETGSFRGKYQVSDTTLLIMKEVEKEGGILPYYGVDGSSGASVYYFIPKPDSFTVKVEHSVTEGSLEIDIPIEDVGVFVDRETSPKFKYSAMPYLVDEELPEAWSKKTVNEIIFRVVGNQYQNLVEWENWTDEQTFSSKYIYRFALVSMGSGFTIKVEDTETGNTIDATDYDDW